MSAATLSIVRSNPSGMTSPPSRTTQSDRRFYPRTVEALNAWIEREIESVDLPEGINPDSPELVLTCWSMEAIPHYSNVECLVRSLHQVIRRQIGNTIYWRARPTLWGNVLRASFWS